VSIRVSRGNEGTGEEESQQREQGIGKEEKQQREHVIRRGEESAEGARE
jgi:hypothetical protein